VALLFGAIHAFGPGHGKTVMAAYLVSTEGRKRDAFALGTIVSLMHTLSVLALAAVLATIGKNLDAARLYPSLTLAAGALVLGVGLRLLQRRLRSRRSRPPSPRVPAAWASATPAALGRQGGVALLDRSAPGVTHHHDHHGHDHDDRHDHDHHGHVHGATTHTHDLPPDVSPLSRSGLIALGTSGGLFPSPSAVVVLLGAFALGRAVLGFALIVAFSVGLAAVLVTIGLLLVAGRRRINESRFAVHLPWLPIAGAAAIVALGFVLVVQGVTQLR
jgi:ABC-type nickel/cobalt efflux system permease component RcnA